jgi:hypothetical protein
VVVDAKKDVGEVVDRVDAIQLAGGDERVETGEALAALLVADEEEDLAPGRDATQRSLGAVVVWRDAWVSEEEAELAPVLEDVPRCSTVTVRPRTSAPSVDAGKDACRPGWTQEESGGRQRSGRISSMSALG